MKRPNILVLFGDQERYCLDDPDCRAANHRRLAERGVTFTQAFTTCP